MTVFCVKHHLCIVVLEKVMMWCEVKVRDESPHPHWKGDHKLVLLLFVHGLRDRWQVFRDGRIVACSPVLHRVLPGGLGIHHVGTSRCHHSDEVRNQVRVDMWRDALYHMLHVSVCCCVVLTEIPHQQGHVKVIMKETCQHGQQLFGADFRLVLPVLVNVSDPSKVICQQ